MGSTQQKVCQPQSGTGRHAMKGFQPVRLRPQSPMRHQRGMGMLSVLAIVAVSVFVGLFAFKVGPHYMENWTVSKIASDVAANPSLLKQPRSKVYSYINQAYRTNNLWDLSPQDTIKLKKDGKLGYVVSVEYEKRDTLFHNIDVVTSFNKQALPTQ